MSEKIDLNKVDLQVIDDPNLASTNFYWVYKIGDEYFNLQTTVRATLTPGQLAAHFAMVASAVTICLGHGGKSKQVGRGADISTTVITTPATEAIAEGEPVSDVAAKAAALGAKGMFDAEWIEVEVKGKKTYFKIGGGRYVQFGVRVWDEVLQEAGISPDTVIKASETADDSHMKMQKHYRAYYDVNDKNNPAKIVLLEKLS
jgi:hypothetical protein